jgi:hypothetical protein
MPRLDVKFLAPAKVWVVVDTPPGNEPLAGSRVRRLPVISPPTAFGVDPKAVIPVTPIPPPPPDPPVPLAIAFAYKLILDHLS